MLLSFVLSKIDETTLTASQIAKTVNVLKAIRWLSEAWGCVKTETVVKCFKTAGVISTDSSVVGCTGEDEDPFAELDADHELSTLVSRISDDGPTCSAQEYAW